MAARNRLTARAAETKAPGIYLDGSGLKLVVGKTGSAKWVFRYQVSGKVSEMGLGSRDDVTLADARQKADAARRLIAQGGDPIADRRERRAREARATFGEVADDLIAAMAPRWKSAKHEAQWKTTLATYAKSLRSRPVDEITTEDVLSTLKPIWSTKPETASRLRGRIEAVLDAAKARGLRTGENPAAWRGHLSHLLPRPKTLTRGHHAAIPYADVPAFVSSLREREGVAALALEFCILTATRTAETIGATWVEIDLDAAVWTIPAERMKAGRQHRVPLSDRALEIIRRLDAAKIGPHVFPATKGRKPLSTMAMLAVLRRMERDDITVHGFRSAFRDWTGNETPFAREIAEQALAHVIGDKAEQAYRRGDALEKRRALMQSWADFVTSSRAANVVAIKRAS